jgi:hypothetical protein
MQYQKGLSTQEIEDFMRECLNNSKDPDSSKLNISGIESLEPLPAPQNSQRSGSHKPQPINTKKVSAYAALMEHKKNMQTVYVKKLKETLTDKVSEHNRKKRLLNCDRSKEAIDTLYDLGTFCAPFDLKDIDEDMVAKNKSIRGGPFKKPMTASATISEANTPRGRGIQEIAFLRQLIEDGYNVSVNSKDKNNLYKKELEEQKLLDAAMEQSPDNA